MSIAELKFGIMHKIVVPRRHKIMLNDGHPGGGALKFLTKLAKGKGDRSRPCDYARV